MLTIIGIVVYSAIATFLTLVVIPCVYAVMDRFGEIISFRKVTAEE